jgi:hypothetical protein
MDSLTAPSTEVLINLILLYSLILITNIITAPPTEVPYIMDSLTVPTIIGTVCSYRISQLVQYAYDLVDRVWAHLPILSHVSQ